MNDDVTQCCARFYRVRSTSTEASDPCLNDRAPLLSLDRAQEPSTLLLWFMVAGWAPILQQGLMALCFSRAQASWAPAPSQATSTGLLCFFSAYIAQVFGPKDMRD